MTGRYETIVEYYTGRDASQLTDRQLALKVAHIYRIRELEREEQALDNLKLFTHARRT